MEKDKYISLGESYVDLKGGVNEVTQFTDDILDGEINIFLYLIDNKKIKIFLSSNFNYNFPRFCLQNV